MEKINPKLFPRLSSNTKEYSLIRDEHGFRIPLEQWIEDKGNKKIEIFILEGEGSIGKSTSLKYLSIHHEDCYYFPLSRLNISTELNRFKNDLFGQNRIVSDHTILLLDAYDEIRIDKTEAKDIIKKLLSDNPNPVILSTRKWSWDLFEDDPDLIAELMKVTSIGKLEPFDSDEIQQIVGEEIRNKNLLHLLKNTMFLSLYLELKNKSLTSPTIQISNETQFLGYYFSHLCEIKNIDSNMMDWQDDLSQIGRIIYNQTTNNEQAYTSRSLSMDKYKYLKDIFTVLKDENPDSDESIRIEGINSKYNNFAASIYFSLSVLDNGNETLKDMISRIASNYYARGFDFKNLSYTDDLDEILYFTGQQLAVHKKLERQDLISNTKNDTDDFIYYMEALVYLGYNDGKLDDPFLFSKLQALNENIKSRPCFLREKSFIKELDIPEGITKISQDYFDGDRLEKVTVPSTLNSITVFGIRGNASMLSTIEVSEKNETFDSKCNAIIDKKSKYLVIGCCKSNLLPNMVKTIGREAFANCGELSFNALPEGIIRIESGAFKRIKNKILSLPNSLEKIENLAFEECNLEEINLGKNIRDFSGSAFDYCKNLHTIIVDPMNANYSDMGCNGVFRKRNHAAVLGCKSTVIPKEITRIETCAFTGVDFENFSLPSQISFIDDFAFRDCIFKYFDMNESTDCEFKQNAFSRCYVGSSIIHIGIRKMNH